MQGVSTSLYKGGLKGYYWRRKGYERLGGGSGRRSRYSKCRVELGSPGSTRRRRFFWRIKIIPKLRLRFSPKKFFIGLRDAYVNMMLRIANSRPISGGGLSGFGGSDGFGSFGRGPLKEYDEKMIVQIYKSLVIAHGQLVPRDAGRIGAQIIGG